MVGLIRIEPRPVTFPDYAILAGKFRTTNNGNHSAAIVDTTGSLGVTVRCTGSIPSSNAARTTAKGQIQPNTVEHRLSASTRRSEPRPRVAARRRPGQRDVLHVLSVQPDG